MKCLHWLLLMATLFAPTYCNARTFSKISFSLPTDNLAVDMDESYIQPTSEGLKNGAYGMVREDGRRYHGGIDIRPVLRDETSQEPLDSVYAIADGQVVYVNRHPQNSSFGRYVVLLHHIPSLKAYSVYAHLDAIHRSILPGKKVTAGTTLGQMGRSSNCYKIPVAQAHLHLEIAVLLSSERSFQHWYDRQRYPSPNHHGQYNGLNWLSIDPLPLLRHSINSQNFSPANYFLGQPVAFTVQIPSNKVPFFLQQCPLFLKKGTTSFRSFTVACNAFGLPMSWTPSLKKVEKAELLSVIPGALDLALRRGTLAKDPRSGQIQLGPKSVEIFKKILDETGR